jgi:hypothetical protein
MKILPALLIGAIALTSPALAADYQPPSTGTLSTGTKESDCTYRGSDRREECILVKSPALEDSIRTL